VPEETQLDGDRHLGDFSRGVAVEPQALLVRVKA
jgi:hypothetical protein